MPDEQDRPIWGGIRSLYAQGITYLGSEATVPFRRWALSVVPKNAST